ncbi:MAG: 50S ribosome-binding GTPase [Bacteroidales bacterium]|nr:50S ribosome-binding GTPase [Bacteroidales bacterium]
MEQKFAIEKMLSAILGDKVSDGDRKQVLDAINKEITERPFRVAVVGQSGVGKSTTLNAVFGLKNYTSDVAEGTKDIEEKKFDMRDGFSLSIYDMPGIGYDMDKDAEYERMYAKILPDCDVIVYIINAHSKDIGEDCRILRDVILPVCNTNKIKDNLILAFNKIDTIGEMQDPNDPELRWNIVENLPTEKLKKFIKVKLGDLTDKLIDEGLIGGADSIEPHQVVFYSAVYNYNLQDFLQAITKAGKRGWIWTGTVGFERIGKWSDKKNSLN